MRSQKRVRVVGKVHSMKNSASAKRKIYRKRLEARKAWQHNTILTGPQSLNILPVPSPKCPKVKEPKQLSEEELAKRQSLRSQRQLEKQSRKLRAITLAPYKTKKEKRAKITRSAGMSKKVSIELRAAAKRASRPFVGRNINGRRNLKTRMVTNLGQQDKQISEKKDALRKAKGELQRQSNRYMIHMKKATKQPILDASCLRHFKGVKRALETPAVMINKTGGKPLEKKGRTKTATETKKTAVPFHPASGDAQHQAVTVQEHRYAAKNTAQMISAGSVVNSKAGMNVAKHEPSKKGVLKQEVVQEKRVKAKGGEHSQLSTDAGAADLLKKHKNKRNRGPDAEFRVSEDDHIVADTRKMNEGEKSADSKEVVGRRHKKKGHPDEQQNGKPVVEAFGDAHNEQNGKQHVSDTSQLLFSQMSRVGKEQKRVERPRANDEMDKGMGHSEPDQTDVSKDTNYKTEKTVDVKNRDDIPTNSETVPKTGAKLEALLSDKPQMNAAKLAEEHPEMLEAGKVDSGSSATEKIFSTTHTKEAKDKEMGTEKREPVVLALERQKEKSTQPVRERVYKLLPRDIQFCVRMIEKYGDDYEAMAKDEGNIFRDTAKGIARKIRVFRESPQYDVYLKQKADKDASVTEK